MISTLATEISALVFSHFAEVPDVRVGEEDGVAERLEVGLHESSQVLDVRLLRLDQLKDHLRVNETDVSDTINSSR